VSRSHGLRFLDTQFWVIHRRTEYGPFDYEWSEDFRGMELHFQGVKFGEVCSVDEIFADLKEFQLPRRVTQVACVVFGTTLLGITGGFSERERGLLLADTLRRFDCSEFMPGHDVN